MHLALYLESLILALIPWQAFALGKSYNSVRSIGRPITVSTTRIMNPFWILLYWILPVRPFLRRLPLGFGKWVDYTYFGWQYDYMGWTHQQLGPAFVLCTPSLNEVMLAEPAATISSRGGKGLTTRPEYIVNRLQ